VGVGKKVEMMETIKADAVVDTRGLLCPMPVVKAKLALEEMKPGQVVKVLSTDPGSLKDFPAWCQETGNRLLLARKEEKGLYAFFIEKGKEG
jgi:tRNA 2-thiouridine synthesizing protein A